MSFVIRWLPALLLMMNCKATSVFVQGNTHQLIEKVLGKSAHEEINKSGQLILAYHLDHQSVHYIVLRIEDQKIVMDERISMGTVTWYNDSAIKVSEAPGMIKRNEMSDNSRVIDLKKFMIKQ